MAIRLIIGYGPLSVADIMGVGFEAILTALNGRGGKANDAKMDNCVTRVVVSDLNKRIYDKRHLAPLVPSQEIEKL